MKKFLDFASLIHKNSTVDLPAAIFDTSPPALKPRETVYQNPTISNMIHNIPITRISPNPWQPRKVFEDNAIEVLADSISLHGVLQPLTVRRLVDESSPLGGIYSLISGERRFRALKTLGWETAPCLIINTTAEGGAAIAIVENLLRENLGFFEEAMAIETLIECHGMSREDVSKKLSLSPSAISNKLRILRLSEEERKLMCESGLSERHARALIRIEDTETRMNALRDIISYQMSVARSEEYISMILNPPPQELLTEDIIESAQNDVSRETSLDGIADDVSRETSGKAPNHKRFLSLVERSVSSFCEHGFKANSQILENDDEFIIHIKISKKN